MVSRFADCSDLVDINMVKELFTMVKNSINLTEPIRNINDYDIKFFIIV